MTAPFGKAVRCAACSMGVKAVEIFIGVALGLLCLGATVVLLAGVLFAMRRSQASAAGAEAPTAGGPPASTSPAAVESARLDPPTANPTELARRPPMPPPSSEEVVEDYEEDAPTTLFDPVALGLRGPRPPAAVAPPVLPPRPAPSPTAPPSHRRARLDSVQVPPPTLSPNATIVPPDDWDFIDEDEADETMLMARPVIPRKK